MITKIDGQLEIDENKSVVYFHSAENGRILLRICGLTHMSGKYGNSIPLDLHRVANGECMLNITNGYGAYLT